MRRRLPLLIFIAAAVTFAAVGTAHGATVVLPFHNFDGFSTSAVVVNPTSDPVTLTDFWATTGFGAPAPVIAPHSVFRASDFPRKGGGVYPLELPDGVYAYSELRYPNGMRVRFNPLTSLNPQGGSLTFYDLVTDGTDYKSYLYLAAPSGATFTVRSYAADGSVLATDAYLMYEPTAQIVPIAAGTSRIEIKTGIGMGGVFPVGPVYAFALISHQPEGQVIVSYPVGVFLTGMP